MSVSHFEVTRRAPYPFDYERIDGILHFAVDPLHPANRGVVDLDKAPRDAQGKVRFAADFLLLQPNRQARANRRLLYYVVNRGQRDGVPFNRFPPRLPTLPPTDAIDSGDGFMMRHGWTVAMCGWQWDVERQPGLMGLIAPQALGPDGMPLRGKIQVAFLPNETHAAHRLAHWPQYPPPGKQYLKHQTYPAADVDEVNAVLTVREWPGGSSRVIPRERWRFARDESGTPSPDDEHVWLEGGFQPGQWYEVTYTTRISPVVGTGLLATRDCVAWLRHGADSPTAHGIDFTYGHGRSQCGRFLRQYVYEGFNLDEDGRQVFDGLLPHVAGARRGEFNQRFGQPSADTHPRGRGAMYPFASDDVPDEQLGTTDGLLHTQRQLGGVPKIFSTNTSSEYWRSDCSLTHTDAAGTRDVEPPAEERIYAIAGHQHGSGVAQVVDTTAAGARGANPFNVVDGATVLRALLVHLDRWVAEGIEPPPSAIPRLSDGTAVTRESVLAQLRDVPGLALLNAAVLPRLRRLDFGTALDQVTPEVGAPYASYVSAVNADGNELAGIRLPDLTVPVATHTGWVARHPATGGEGQLLNMMGTTLPFAGTAAQRQARGDPRASIAERYRDRDDYVTRARAAAERLAGERYILEEDIELVVQLAAQRYDLFAPTLARVGG